RAGQARRAGSLRPPRERPRALLHGRAGWPLSTARTIAAGSDRYTLLDMKGAVAAGHPLTAEAGAEVLRDGGNAVDACIAAGVVSWVAESTLTGPGAGGFLLVRRADGASTRVLDHFVAVPGLGLG